jgi:glucoamylase
MVQQHHPLFRVDEAEQSLIAFASPRLDPHQLVLDLCRGIVLDEIPNLMRSMTEQQDHAPGAPGIPPSWTSSAKDMVGCSLGPSRLWFALGFGIVNEVYYPRVDIPQIRDLGFIVAGPGGFWSEVKRNENYRLRLLAPGVPAVEVVHEHARYTLRLRISPDPRRDVLAIECSLDGDADLTLHVLLAPHLGATGYGNLAAVERYRGRCVLWAKQGPFGTALAAADEAQHDAFRRASAGYAGTSDGWQDFARNGAMTWNYRSAGPGNVALIGELPRRAALALGFGSSAEAAATLAISSLMQPFDNLLQQQIAEWEAWQAQRSERFAAPLNVPAAVRDEFLVSTVVLRAHLDKTYPGAMVASLSVPWGDTGDERGGYHLVWPRDLVECAGALLALGAETEARDTLRYLLATQTEDGHWHQNQWLGGTAYWHGVQLDETAFPVLLASALEERDALGGIEVEDMVRRALGYIACTGPATAQDRWEENEGINPFTLAVCIAALVAGAGLLPAPAQRWALALADFWNAQIEAWTTVTGSALAQRFGVPGHYVRVAPRSVVADAGAIAAMVVPIRNRSDAGSLRGDAQVGTECLQLVRFGLRRADDPLIAASLRVIDGCLKTDTPNGPVWHRYGGDGYGEHEDGRAFDGTGIGRGWPLLAGERGHYELCAGRDPLAFLETMAAMASPGGMIPEQVWDSDPIPQRHLFPGRPSGSAMPLAWAHAEFVKLLVSRQLGHPFDRPRAVWQRYQGSRPKPGCAFWWPQAAITSLPPSSRLVIALPRPALIHWGLDGWQSAADEPTDDTGLGFHAAMLDTARANPGQRIDFTWLWRDSGNWHGRDYAVAVARE